MSNRTVPTGCMVETASRVMIVNRADVVPMPYGWGLIVRGEKGAENENQI